MRRDLVERAMAGDHDAFAELVRASIARLFSAARLILRDDGRAEDATQEALVVAWRDLSALRDPDRFEAWLHRLLVRACYREARRGRQRWMIEAELPPDAELRPAAGTIPDMALDFADRDQLERGFRRLGADLRAVLVLHYYVGMSASAVAETLEIPKGTAQSRLHRALAELRAAVAADERAPAEQRTVIA